MRTMRVVAAVAVGAVTFVAVACSVDVDLENKACPCGDGYVCDTSRNVCVTPDKLTDAADVDGFLPDGGRPCPDDKCPCERDEDCKDPTRSKCHADTKTCVECLRAPADTCPAGQYCNELNQCTLGCKQDSDCQISPAVPHCNLTNHQCVECLTPSHCAADAGLLCSPSGRCVEGCDLDAGIGCTGGKTCCGLFCLDLQTDLLNCGACNVACSTTNGTPVCSSGSCTWPTNNCASGFRHCQSGNTGCETNIRTVTHCGSCTTDCLTSVRNADGIFCITQGSTSSCSYASCKAGFGNCDGDGRNGCDCACGSFAGQICCPAPTPACSFPNGKCVGQNPAKCQ